MKISFFWPRVNLSVISKIEQTYEVPVEKVLILTKLSDIRERMKSSRPLPEMSRLVAEATINLEKSAKQFKYVFETTNNLQKDNFDFSNLIKTILN